MAGRVLRTIPFFVALILASSTMGVEAQFSREYEIKAAFLYNFAKFVDWPEEALPKSAPNVVLCVLGEDPFGTALETINDKEVKSRRLVVRRLPAGNVDGCHLLFISSSEQKRLPELFKSLERSSMLTVGETPRFAELGGIVNFFIQANNIRFEVNVEAAERVKLKISSRLLHLAKVVKLESH